MAAPDVVLSFFTNLGAPFAHILCTCPVDCSAMFCRDVGTVTFKDFCDSIIDCHGAISACMAASIDASNSV
ncbi:hypothetical protein, partial [Propionivibrio sp.]|uniref:hypothetical protein n=1 Tax=Propionivibrio sp. TaxID=2212460 RepID=UPI003BF2BBFF